VIQIYHSTTYDFVFQCKQKQFDLDYGNFNSLYYKMNSGTNLGIGLKQLVLLESILLTR
jgi:hypothetical protein